MRKRLCQPATRRREIIDSLKPMAHGREETQEMMRTKWLVGISRIGRGRRGGLDSRWIVNDNGQSVATTRLPPSVPT
ncbi:MAG: hypothetical protein JNL67_03845 [Planctomycetaceae bacterium]|nr:hypothetical protein [Planctomycetaceae bacterium]